MDVIFVSTHVIMLICIAGLFYASLFPGEQFDEQIQKITRIVKRRS